MTTHAESINSDLQRQTFTTHNQLAIKVSAITATLVVLIAEFSEFKSRLIEPAGLNPRHSDVDLQICRNIFDALNHCAMAACNNNYYVYKIHKPKRPLKR